MVSLRANFRILILQLAAIEESKIFVVGDESSHVELIYELDKDVLMTFFSS